MLFRSSPAPVAHAPRRGALADPQRRRLALGAGLSIGLGAGLSLLPAGSMATPSAAAATVPPAWRQRATRPLMGTRVSLIAEAADARQAAALPAALDHAFGRMAALAALMTHYEPTSGTSAIGLAAGLQPVAVAPELMAVLQQAQGLAQRSGGAFDITVGATGVWRFDDPGHARHPTPAQIAQALPLVGWPGLHLDARAGTAMLARRGMRLDLGGIAKLPILQAGLQALAEAGVQRALVDGGGDVLATSPEGHDARFAPWRVGVRDPAQPQRLLGVLPLHRGVVASSGDYERCSTDPDGTRWHHVLDPRTGRPTQRARGVTLLANDVARVNGLGAALMVLDERAGRALLAATPGVQAVVTRRDGTRWGQLSQLAAG